MAKLVITPLGSSARDRFCKELEQLEYGQGALILPNRLLMDDVEQKYNIEAMGMDTLATKLLNLNGYVYFNQINRRSQELVVQEMIDDLLDGANMEYFDQLAQKPGFVKAMTSLVGQLSRSGSTVEQIVQILSSWGRSGRLGQKDKEVALLYKYYRYYLKQKNWFDLEGKYRLAMRVLQNEKSKLPWRQLYFCDFYSFDSLQLEFIKALTQRCQVTIGLCYEKNLEHCERGKLFEATRDTYLELEKLCLDDGIENHKPERQLAANCRHLCENYGLKANPVPQSEAVQLYRFSERDQELRYALTRAKQLMEKGVPAQEIVIAVRDLAQYTGLRLIADEYGIPVTLPQSTNLAVQPLLELVLLLLQAARDTHEGAEAYIATLCSPLARLLLTLDGEAVNNLRQEHYFKTRSGAQQLIAEKFPAEDAVQALLDGYLNALPAKADVCTYAEQLRKLLQSLQLVRRLGELYKQGNVTLAALALSLQAERELYGVLTQLVEDYQSCGQGQKTLKLSEWQVILTDAVAQVELLVQKGRKDGVRITSVVNLQGLEYDYVMLLGLREGEFPKANTENWIYNDTERKVLKSAGLDMSNTSFAYAEDACFFGAAIGCARKQLLLSYYYDDKAGASPYLDNISKLFLADGATETEKDSTIRAEENPSKVYASAEEAARKLAGGEAWLEEYLGSATLDASKIDALRNEQLRYNGELSDVELQKIVRKAVGSSFSASALETYAACPFQYLGQRVWRGQEFAAVEDELTPVDEGDILHEVLASFMGKYLNVKLTDFPLEKLQEELHACFAAVVEEALAQGKIIDNVLWQSERPRLEKMLLMWLKYEYADQKEWSFKPCAVEWDFSSKNGKPLHMRTADGTRVSLVGRIDRLDSDGARIFVTDYKRSGSSVPTGKQLADGFDVQLPLYLLAVAGLYKDIESVAGGTYFVLKKGQRESSFLLEPVDNKNISSGSRYTREISSSWASFQSFAQKLIGSYVDGIYNGKFMVAPRKQCSDYCALKDICRLCELNQAQGGGQDE